MTTLQTGYVISKDGTRIAFDRLGRGSPVIVVGGMLCDRRKTAELAQQLAQEFCVINYDRRGRGDSSDTAPYAVEREVEDIAALISAAGGTAFVYGHSSGAALALRAAASRLPITRLVLHEPPYGPDDEGSKRSARELAGKVVAALAEDRGSDAIALFMTAAGVPQEMAEGMSSDLKTRAMAPTMAYEFEVTGEIREGGVIPEDLVRSVSIPTLVIAGGASPDFFRATATRVAEILPNGKHSVLDGQDHGAPANVVAPVVAEFFNA
jgi:pimeloyl-ACP methyl ester carboxylesterase